MNREIENVLHGGAAMIARNSPLVARSSRDWYTASRRISPLVPPPMLCIAVYARNREAALTEEGGQTVVPLIGS